ncbi:Plasma kallikrein, partial [Operophtera brumata]
MPVHLILEKSLLGIICCMTKPLRVEDEWVPEKEVKRIKRVEIASLPAHAKVVLYEHFCDSYRKAPCPPPAKKRPATPPPSRLQPARHCTSTRLLNNLIAKQRKSIDVRSECSAPTAPLIFKEEERADRAEFSGAKKRKL